MRSLNKKLQGIFHIAGKVVNMEELASKSEEIMSRYYKKGIKEFHVRLFVCIRGKYLYFSRYQVVGVERKTNKWVKLSQGIGPIVRYAVAKWKWDHARAKEIEWNVIKFDFDGYDVDIDDTTLDSDIMRRAKMDARDGIVMRNARALMNFLNRATIGEIKPGKKSDDEEEDDNDHSDLGV